MRRIWLAPTWQPAAATRRVRLALVCALAWLVLTANGQSHAQSRSAATPAVVVWDFDDQSPPGLASAATAGDFLKRSLSESLTAQLLQVPGLPVLERQRLHDLMAEQKVAASELADQDSRLRLGRVVGARRMVFGGYLLLGEWVQVHVRVVDTATSRVLFSDETSAELAQVMQQVQPLNQRLARALGGTAAAAAGSHAAASWQAYDQALALADAGRIDDAVQALQNLLARDKAFTPAERQLVALLDKMARR